MTKEQAIKLLSKDTSVDEIHRLRDKGLSHTEVTDKIQEAMDMGIEALEKQVAKKVTVEGVYDYWGDEVDNEYTCPTCLKEDYVHYRDIKYCWNCGQKLDLSEVE